MALLPTTMLSTSMLSTTILSMNLRLASVLSTDAVDGQAVGLHVDDPAAMALMSMTMLSTTLDEALPASDVATSAEVRSVVHCVRDSHTWA